MTPTNSIFGKRDVLKMESVGPEGHSGLLTFRVLMLDVLMFGVEGWGFRKFGVLDFRVFICSGFRMLMVSDVRGFRFLPKKCP